MLGCFSLSAACSADFVISLEDRKSFAEKTREVRKRAQKIEVGWRYLRRGHRDALSHLRGEEQTRE